MPQEAETAIDRVLTLQITRVTERAAIAAALVRGRGDEELADRAAAAAMRSELNRLDVRGRIAAMIDAHGGAIRYEHNAVNKLTAVTDQLGRQTTLTYDAAGRHLATTYVDPRADGLAAPPAALARDAEYTRDMVQRVAAARVIEAES